MAPAGCCRTEGTKCGVRMTLVLPALDGGGLWARSPSAKLLPSVCIPIPSFLVRHDLERVPLALLVCSRGRSPHLSLSKAPSVSSTSIPASPAEPFPRRRRLLEKASSKPQRCVIVLSAFKPCRMSLCHNFSSLGGAGKTP